jgi:hypothetical protein
MSSDSASILSDEERFKDVEKLNIICIACGECSEFPGVFYNVKGKDAAVLAPRGRAKGASKNKKRGSSRSRRRDCKKRKRGKKSRITETDKVSSPAMPHGAAERLAAAAARGADSGDAKRAPTALPPPPPMGARVSGFRCTNPACTKPEYWGADDVVDCVSRLQTLVTASAYKCTRQYGQGVVRCDAPACHYETRKLSVVGSPCLAHGCNGKMSPVYTDKDMHTQLEYLVSLFDVDHACRQQEKVSKGAMSHRELLESISSTDKEAFKVLLLEATHHLEMNGYNTVDPGFYQNLFGQIGLTSK